MTDNWRFRVNWRGKLILQRLRKFRHLMDWWEFTWSDANATDLADFYRENNHD